MTGIRSSLSLRDTRVTHLLEENEMAKDELPFQTVRSDGGTTWVEITSVGTDDEARLLQGFLEAEGVPAQIENVKFSMEPINFGVMGDIRIYVPADKEQHAVEL